MRNKKTYYVIYNINIYLSLDWTQPTSIKGRNFLNTN